MAIPKGLTKCKICGQFNGKVKERNLNWDVYFAQKDKESSDKYLAVSCLCDGILCPKCKRNKIPRPISNSYDEESNQVWHNPAFMGMAMCSECRSVGKQA
jgi:hypothetical protein